jgi:hypothetical protein
MKKLVLAFTAVLALAFAAPVASACPGHDEVSDDKKASEDTTAQKKPAKKDGEKAKKADKTEKGAKKPAETGAAS